MTWKQLIDALENFDNSKLNDDVSVIHNGEVYGVVTVRTIGDEDLADTLWEGHIVLEIK